MSLTDSKWTHFQIEAEESTYGLERIVEAHNEIYGKMEYAQKCMVELEKENEELKKAICINVREHTDLEDVWEEAKWHCPDDMDKQVLNEFVKESKRYETKEQSK